MAMAKMGDRIRLHYTGKLTDGTVFDSSENAGDEVFRNFRGRGVAFGPMELVIGAGEMLPAFEDALVGLEPGQQKTFTIPADRAFGVRQRGLVTIVGHDEIAPRELGIASFRVAEGRHRPNVFDPKIGDVLELTGPDGTLVPARVAAMTDESITLDSNHPLAGRDLVFDVRLIGIV
jgi:peptidylprolyl isomerase